MDSKTNKRNNSVSKKKNVKTKRIKKSLQKETAVTTHASIAAAVAATVARVAVLDITNTINNLELEIECLRQIEYKLATEYLIDYFIDSNYIIINLPNC